MSGRLVRVIPRRGYNFSALAPNGSADVTLAKGIDAIEYDKVDLLVRIHELQIGGSDGYFEVQIGSDGSTCEDPGRNFGTQFGGIIIDANAKSGEFKTAQFNGPLGSMLMVVLSAKQDGMEPGDLMGEFSVDLVLKS